MSSSAITNIKIGGPIGPQGPIGPIGLTGATGSTGISGSPGGRGLYFLSSYPSGNNIVVELSDGSTAEIIGSFRGITNFDANAIKGQNKTGTGFTLFSQVVGGTYYFKGITATGSIYLSYTGANNEYISIDSIYHNIDVQGSLDSVSLRDYGLLYLSSPTTASGVPVRVFTNQSQNGLSGAINFLNLAKDAGASGDYGYALNSGSTTKVIGPVSQGQSPIYLNLSEAGTFVLDTPAAIAGFTGFNLYSTNEIISVTLVFESEDVWHFPQNVYFEQGENYLTCGKNIIGLMSYDRGQTWLATVAQRGHNIRNPDTQCKPNYLYGSCCYTNADGTFECSDYVTKAQCDFNFGVFNPLKSCAETCGKGGGVCCTNGKCVEITSVAECDFFGGSFYPGISCDTYTNNPNGPNYADPIENGRLCYDPCQASVSCCKDGKCLGTYSRIQCEQILGGIAVPNTTCSTVDCCNYTSTVGACCVCNGNLQPSCFDEIPKALCDSLGGIFMGENEKCDQLSCNCVCGGGSTTSPPGGLTFTCNSDGTCTVDPNGSFSDLPSCQSFCSGSNLRYSCTTGYCRVTPGGQYTTSTCDGNCDPPPPPPTQRYNCVVGVCIQTPGGQYPFLSQCQAECSKEPPPPPCPPEAIDCDNDPTGPRPPTGPGTPDGPDGPSGPPSPCGATSGDECCCIEAEWCQRQIVNGVYSDVKKTRRQKLCNRVRSTDQTSVCGLIYNGTLQSHCSETRDDILQFAKCCYKRRNPSLCPNSGQNQNDPAADYCNKNCNDPNIDWSRCNQISDAEIIDYVKLKSKTCGVKAGCTTQMFLRALLCCNNAGTNNGCASICSTQSACGGMSSTASDCTPCGSAASNACTIQGDWPPDPGVSPGFDGMYPIYGYCDTTTNKCVFTPAYDACEKQCIAIRNPCRALECRRAGLESCPGLWMFNGEGCGCPEPGTAYDPCPGSFIEPSPSSPPSPLTGDESPPPPPPEDLLFRVQIVKQDENVQDFSPEQELEVITEDTDIVPVKPKLPFPCYTKEEYPGILPWNGETEIEDRNPDFWWLPGYTPKIPTCFLGCTSNNDCPLYQTLEIVPLHDPLTRGICGNDKVVCPSFVSQSCVCCDACKLDPAGPKCLECVDGIVYDPNGSPGYPWDYDPEQEDGVLSPDELLFAQDYLCKACVRLFNDGSRWWYYVDGKWAFRVKWCKEDCNGRECRYMWVQYVPGLGVPMNVYENCIYYPGHESDPFGDIISPDGLCPDWVQNPIGTPYKNCNPIGVPPDYYSPATYPDNCIAVQSIVVRRTTNEEIFKKPEPDIRMVKIIINNQEVCVPILCEGVCDGYTFCE